MVPLRLSFSVLEQMIRMLHIRMRILRISSQVQINAISPQHKIASGSAEHSSQHQEVQTNVLYSTEE
jgi:hypothetical protein